MRSNHKYGVRRDSNHAEIAQALRKAGWHVWDELPVDFLVWRPGSGFRTLEVKSPGLPLKPKKGPQERFVELTGCPIVNSIEQAFSRIDNKTTYVAE